MSKLRRKLITVLAVLFCALLCLSTALIIPKSKTANAERQIGTDHWVEIGEIYNDNHVSQNKNAFSAANLRKLYMAITGDKKANYKTLENALNSSATPTDNNNTRYIASDAIRANNDGKNVLLTFGGIKWDVTYVTFDMDGNIIVDLWQSADSLSSQLSKWANNADDDTSVNYPSNMYSTSYIRVVSLNAGGYTSKQNNNNELNDKAEQNPANEYGYARFTMANGEYSGVTISNSLTAYIVKPERVEYQKNEYSMEGTTPGSGNNVATGHNNPNDAWYKPAEPADGGWIQDSYYDFDYTGKDKYGDWKSDYLWLPSLTETGRSRNGISGIWMANDNLRSSGTNSNSPNSWLRSGHNTVANFPFALTYDAGATSIEATTLYSVRPALHLNLTAAANVAKGVSYDAVEASANVDENTKEIKYGTDTDHTFTHVYDGTTVSITLNNLDNLQPITSSDYSSDAIYNNGTFTSGKYSEENGTKSYEINVKLKDGYFWDDTDTKEDRKYTIDITLADFDVGWEDFDAALGDSLLLSNDDIGVQGNSADAPLTVMYFIISPNDPDSPPENTAEWTLRDESSDPKVEAAGSYRVYYELTAKYHNTKKSSYYVSVGVERVKIQSTGTIGSAVYSEGDTVKLTDQS